VADPGGRCRDVIYFQRNYSHLCDPAIAAAKVALAPGQSWNMAEHNKTIRALLNAQGPGFIEQMLAERDRVHAQNAAQYEVDLAAVQTDEPTPNQWAQ
jgi:hypothetical protein